MKRRIISLLLAVMLIIPAILLAGCKDSKTPKELFLGANNIKSLSDIKSLGSEFGVWENLGFDGEVAIEKLNVFGQDVLGGGLSLAFEGKTGNDSGEGSATINVDGEELKLDVKAVGVGKDDMSAYFNIDGLTDKYVDINIAETLDNIPGDASLGIAIPSVGGEQIKKISENVRKLVDLLLQKTYDEFESLDESKFTKTKVDNVSVSSIVVGTADAVKLSLTEDEFKAILRSVIDSTVNSEELKEIIRASAELGETSLDIEKEVEDTKTEIDKTLEKISLSLISTVWLVDDKQIGQNIYISGTVDGKGVTAFAEVLQTDDKSASTVSLEYDGKNVLGADFSKVDENVWCKLYVDFTDDDGERVSANVSFEKNNYAITANVTAYDPESESDKTFVDLDMSTTDGKTYIGKLKLNAVVQETEIPITIMGSVIFGDNELTVNVTEIATKVQGLDVSAPVTATLNLKRTDTEVNANFNLSADIEGTFGIKISAKANVKKLDSVNITAPTDTMTLDEFSASLESGEKLQAFIASHPKLGALFQSITDMGGIDSGSDGETIEWLFGENDEDFVITSDGYGHMSISATLNVTDDKFTISFYNVTLEYDCTFVHDDLSGDYYLIGDTKASYSGFHDEEIDADSERYFIISNPEEEATGVFISAYGDEARVDVLFTYTVTDEGFFITYVNGKTAKMEYVSDGDIATVRKFILLDEDNKSFEITFQYNDDPSGLITPIENL